jgi:hypothetical protein
MSDICLASRMSGPAGIIGPSSGRGANDWDNFLGAGLADQLLKTMRSEGNYGTFNSVIRDMIAGGIFDGVEAGFISEIAKDIVRRDVGDGLERWRPDVAKRLTA